MPEEYSRDGIAEQGRDNDDSDVERDVVFQGEAKVVKGRDSRSRKLLDRTGRGAKRLELSDGSSKAINQCCQL